VAAALHVIFFFVFGFLFIAKPQINTKAGVLGQLSDHCVGIFSLLFSILVVIIHHAVSVIFIEGPTIRV
jgi:hypothetical protein